MPHDPAADGWSIRLSNPFMQSIGTLWEKSLDGRTSFGIVCEPRHDNGFGRMHGALMTTLADQGLAIAAIEERNRGSHTHYTLDNQATIHLDVHFLTGVGIGEFISSRCEVTRQTASLSFVRGLLVVGEEAVCSIQGIFKVLRQKAG